MNSIIWPRQARDKHREISITRPVFLRQLTQSRSADRLRWFAQVINAICAPFYAKKDRFYQDRLGTNIGKLKKRGGAFSDSNGDQLMTFTGHGWAYGLLQHDFIEDFLLLFYTTSAHAYSRGSWVAPESTNVNRAEPSVMFATPSGLSQPIFLRWLLLFDDPISDCLWVGKAIPHEWFSPGEAISAAALPSRFGSLSFDMHSTDDAVRANITFDGSLLAGWPAGGVKVRVRTRMQWAAAGAVMVDGRPWAATNATEQTIVFAKRPPAGQVAHSIVVTREHTGDAAGAS